MKKALIISSSQQIQEDLERASASIPNSREMVGFYTEASLSQPANWWFVSGPDVLIVDITQEPEAAAIFLSTLEKLLPRSLPIIFVCSEIERNLMTTAGLFNRTRILKRPAQASFLFRAVLDLAAVDPNQVRASEPRYLTDHLIELEAVAGDHYVQAKMRNLSFGGFYCETLSEDYSFQLNQVIRVSVWKTDEIAEDFEAKIVWIKKLASDFSLGMGCQFVNTEKARLVEKVDRLLKES